LPEYAPVVGRWRQLVEPIVKNQLKLILHYKKPREIKSKDQREVIKLTLINITPGARKLDLLYSAGLEPMGFGDHFGEPEVEELGDYPCSKCTVALAAWKTD
jgi:hypothetical protein